MHLPFSLRSKITPSSATAVALSLLPFLYFYPATTGKLILSPDDGTIFNVPLRVAAANLLRSGFLPLWNPYIFCGMPLHGAAQAGLLFPLNWFYLGFNAPVATNLMMLSTYMVAALGAYLYARRTGSSIAGAAVTSLAWQWGGFLIAQIGHTNVVHTAALLPWVLWAIDGYGASGNKRRALILAVLVALQVFAGHQQTLVYTLLVAGAYALVMARVLKQSRASYLWSLVFIAAGLALAAVQILPTAELLRNSMRSEASYSFFSSFSLPPRFLWTFFAPYVVGGGDGVLFRAPYVGPAFYGEYVGYVGVATIVLASLGVVLKRDARTKFWLVVALAGVLLALGRFLPFDLYALIYHTPVLGLFRVPARHLMEVEFALAVLAGRGLTAIAGSRDGEKIMRPVLSSCAVVFVLVCIAVTLGRPASFRLGRAAPVTLLRAPELFLPIVVAAFSVWAIWVFSRRSSGAGRRGATILLFAVLAGDLLLWGQFSGWRLSSPKDDSELWKVPATVRFIRERNNGEPYRILTQDQPFDPNIPVQATPPGGGWVLELQPDIYMMHGVQNAAGYDGFGLRRYSRLASDMKVWGELTDAERTLRGESREIDLLNVHYLLTRPLQQTDTKTISPSLAEHPIPTQVYGGQQFGEEDLNATISHGERLKLNLPPIEVDRISLLSNLSWSENVPDGTVVARMRLQASDGRIIDFDMRAGEHTAEWAYDRADIRSRIKHKRAPVATSYEVVDAQEKYEGHTYVSSFSLPQKTVVTNGEISVAEVKAAPELLLGLTRIALTDGKQIFPVRRDWVRKESGTESNSAASPSPQDGTPAAQRWKRLTQLGNVVIFENTRPLPRAWLTTSELVTGEEEELKIIRTGKTPDGKTWDPLQTALVEASTGIQFSKEAKSRGDAEIVRDEPNRVEVRTNSTAPALLVLSDNHYPGWRAYVDGKLVPTLRANYNLRAVALPTGNHTVEFVYVPKSVLVGLFISLLTLITLLLGLVARGGLKLLGQRNQK